MKTEFLWHFHKYTNLRDPRSDLLLSPTCCHFFFFLFHAGSELVYSKFVSLVKSDPVIHTLLPLSPKGVVHDVNENCVDAMEDEF